jgi:hypothetical protein
MPVKWSPELTQSAQALGITVLAIIIAALVLRYAGERMQ